MSELIVDWSQMRMCADQINGCQRVLQQCIDQVNTTKRQIQWQIRMQMDITSRLNCSIDRMKTMSSSVGKMSSVLDHAANQYRKTEFLNLLGGAVPAMVLDWTGIPKIIGGTSSSGGGGRGTDKLWESAILSGAGTIAGTIFGLNASGTASYEVIGGSVDTFGNAKWNLEKGELGAQGGIKADGYVLEGSAEGGIGGLHGSVKGEILTGSVSGGVGASLMKDGVFAPSLQGKVKAEGSVAHGEGEVHFGSDENNLHVNTEGDVLHGEVEGKAGIGVLTQENADGSVETVVGAEAKVSAEGYVFSGEVSGGFSIFGIKFDASVEGNALGAGFEAGGSVTTNGISGNIGAGLGLGAGIEISIDWSDFHLPDWDSIFPW